MQTEKNADTVPYSTYHKCKSSLDETENPKVNSVLVKDRYSQQNEVLKLSG